jgi:TIR domain
MFDVFISYGHQDQAWVHTLAKNLYRAGLEVFYDEWEIGPGDVLVHQLDEGIRTSRTGFWWSARPRSLVPGLLRNMLPCSLEWWPDNSALFRYC